MPISFEASELKPATAGGVTRTRLADRAVLGADSLQIERVRLEPGAATSAASVLAGEHFIYVIQGAGQAHVGRESFPLEAESILWLEPGDTFFLEAGSEVLEMLQCRAPAAG